MTAQEKNQEYMKLCQKRGIEPPTVQTIEDVFIFQCFLAGMDSAEIEQLLEMKFNKPAKRFDPGVQNVRDSTSF